MASSWRSLGTACCSCVTALLPWVKPGSLPTVLIVPHVLCGFAMSSCTKFSSFIFLDSTVMYVWVAHQCFLLIKHPKRIRLQSLMLSHGFFRTLNNDCSVLEHVQLEGCSLSYLKEISSRSLKVLCIMSCFIIKGLLICATNLTHLSILDPICHSGAIVTRGLSSLVTASISLRSENFHYKEIRIEDHGLLDGLSLATTLELHAPLPEVRMGYYLLVRVHV